MQRFIGSLLIIAATTGAGVLYGTELKRYLEKLLYIRHVIYMLKGEMAVSYTHLRAHETRSNLVCRLLLEKNFF